MSKKSLISIFLASGIFVASSGSIAFASTMTRFSDDEPTMTRFSDDEPTMTGYNSNQTEAEAVNQLGKTLEEFKVRSNEVKQQRIAVEAQAKALKDQAEAVLDECERDIKELRKELGIKKNSDLCPYPCYLV